MKTAVDLLTERVIGYYADRDVSQIAHTLCVVAYTHLLAVSEAYDSGRIQRLEMAALLHDIGCPDAQLKYGNSLPVNQQKEGVRIVAEWSAHEPFASPDDAQWIAQVVATHHNALKAVELGFEVLFEADLIVNLLEGYYPIEQAAALLHNAVRTPSGKALFSRLFALKA